MENIQVDGSSTVYLFFYDRHGCRGLKWEAALSVCSHLADMFLEWIEWSAHFEVLPLLLADGCHHAAAAQDRHRQCVWAQDPSNLWVNASMAASSGSSLQLVGRAPLVPEGQEGGTCLWTPKTSMVSFGTSTFKGGWTSMKR